MNPSMGLRSGILAAETLIGGGLFWRANFFLYASLVVARYGGMGWML